jgi:hypothetical protein
MSHRNAEPMVFTARESCNSVVIHSWMNDKVSSLMTKVVVL